MHNVIEISRKVNPLSDSNTLDLPFKVRKCLVIIAPLLVPPVSSKLKV